MLCTHCKKEVWYSKGQKLEPDKTTMHICSAGTEFVSTQSGFPTSNKSTPMTVDRSSRIDELAMMKIDAIKEVAAAIRDLASAVRMRDLDKDIEDYNSEKKVIEKEEEHG